MNKEQLQRGAKQLLYNINGQQFDFHSVMEFLKQSPEQLLYAEKVMWQIPIGFICKMAPTDSTILDYYKCIAVDGTDVESKGILYQSVRTAQMVPLFLLLGNPVAYPNYDEEFQIKYIEMMSPPAPKKAEDPVGISMHTPDDDLFIYSPNFYDGPFVIRKGSCIPEEFVLQAVYVNTGKRKNQENWAELASFIANYKIEKRNGKTNNGPVDQRAATVPGQINKSGNSCNCEFCRDTEQLAAGNAGDDLSAAFASAGGKRSV